MTQTITDALAENSGKGVLVLMHGQIEKRHVVAQCNGDVIEARVLEMSHRVPASFLPLSVDGIAESTAQGWRFSELGISPARIVSAADPGCPQTAIAIADGIAESRKEETLLPIRHDKAIDGPVYRHEGLADRLRSEAGSMIPQWFNWRTNDFCMESSEKFEQRAMALIYELIGMDGLSLVVAGEELLILLHALAVRGEWCGAISHDWTPKPNHGVLITEIRNDYPHGFDVLPDLTVLGR